MEKSGTVFRTLLPSFILRQSCSTSWFFGQLRRAPHDKNTNPSDCLVTGPLKGADNGRMLGLKLMRFLHASMPAQRSQQPELPPTDQSARTVPCATSWERWLP